jgi:hypothetical protein
MQKDFTTPTPISVVRLDERTHTPENNYHCTDFECVCWLSGNDVATRMHEYQHRAGRKEGIMSGDTHMTGYTPQGDDIELYTEQAAQVCYVSLTGVDLGYIQFNFNPDFPADARKFYLALCEIISIEWEGRS